MFVQSLLSRPCHFISPPTQVGLFLTRDFFYPFASEKSPLLVMLHIFCGCCYGREEECATQSSLLILVPFACVSAVFVHLLGFACWISLQRRKISNFILDVTNLPESTTPHMHRMWECVWERECVYLLFVCMCVYIYINIIGRRRKSLWLIQWPNHQVSMATRNGYESYSAVGRWDIPHAGHEVCR